MQSRSLLSARLDRHSNRYSGRSLALRPEGASPKDAIGNGHDGLIKGPKWVKGKHKFGLKFDGKSDIVEIPHHKDLILGQYTIVAWIKPVANGKWRTVVGKEPTEPPRSFGVYLGVMTMR